MRIWRTKGGKYVAHISRYTRYDNESGSDTAKACASASEVIEWLRQGRQTLGEVSQKAVEEAAERDDGFASAWKEEVE